MRGLPAQESWSNNLNPYSARISSFHILTRAHKTCQWALSVDRWSSFRMLRTRRVWPQWSCLDRRQTMVVAPPATWWTSPSSLTSINFKRCSKPYKVQRPTLKIADLSTWSRLQRLPAVPRIKTCEPMKSSRSIIRATPMCRIKCLVRGATGRSPPASLTSTAT